MIRSSHVRTSRPILGLLVLVALTLSGGTASAAAASTNPNQLLTVLRSDHEAYARPSLRSRPLELVPAERPLTGVRTTLPVLGEATGAKGGHWLRIRLPGRPNGLTGWIEQGGTTATATRWHLVVHTSRRQVIVYERGRRVKVFKAVVGKPSTPTPQGEFFVEEAVRLRAGDVGAPFALALSARSNVLQEFEGGPGQIALHGVENVGGVLGTAVSHGCIRLATSTMVWLAARVGPGVPVTILG